MQPRSRCSDFGILVASCTHTTDSSFAMSHHPFFPQYPQSKASYRGNRNQPVEATEADNSRAAFANRCSIG
jgi:hypothetical protein